MWADQQEVMQRIHRVLVREVGSRNLGQRSALLTVADIYYDLVPFQTRQAELGIQSMNEYEEALLRLLSGQGGFLELESLSDRHRVQRHVDFRNPDPGLFRDLLTAGVRLRSATEEEPFAGDERKDMSQLEDCPSCSEPLRQRAEASFCPFCGTDLRRVLCVSCHEELRLDWKFCIACGTEVGPQGGTSILH